MGRVVLVFFVCGVGGTGLCISIQCSTNTIQLVGTNVGRV